MSKHTRYPGSNSLSTVIPPRNPMASTDQLKALIKSHLERDDEQFFSVAMQVAAHEAKIGHGKMAEELREMIDAAKLQGIRAPRENLVPIARPRGDVGNLLTIVQPKERLADLVLGKEKVFALQRILREQRKFADIRAHGLSPRRKLLLVGPPGTGKTFTAGALAGELGVPLFLVKLDALITKFMGETAAKLRQIFDAITANRGVYFFDEFDAIGSHRDRENDVGEIRRVLNSFLQMIEQDRSNSLILAATNHPEILDYALFRRFDDVIEYELPSVKQRVELIQSRMGRFAPRVRQSPSLAKAASGLSHAEICRAVDESIKEAILQQESAVSLDSLLRMLAERRLIASRLSNHSSKKRHAKSLRRKTSSPRSRRNRGS